MTEVVRLTWVSHGMTDAMAAGRFPADEPLNVMGQRQRRARSPEVPETVICGPERRVRQTAAWFTAVPTVDPRLADLDVGDWRGASLDDIAPVDIATWLGDPSAAPHGGESVTALLTRVGHWMRSLQGTPTRVTAVTHPAVVRAAVLVALDSPATAFWRIDIAPAGETRMHYRDGSWTLRL